MSEKWWEKDPVATSGDSDWWANDPIAEAEAPQKKRGVTGVAADLAKGIGGSAVSAVGMVPTAIGRMVQEGGEKLFGLSMDEAKRMADAEGAPDKALEWYEKSNRLNPISIIGRGIQGGGDWIGEQGEKLRDARSEQAKEKARLLTPDGDITKPSTWTMGKDPSIEGVLQVGADVMGSMAPPIAAAVATRGRSAATQMRAGGAVVAGQIGGAAMGEAGEYLGQFSDEQLRQASPVFRKLEADGYSAADARTLVQREAENTAAAFAAPVGYVGGKATAALLGKPGEKLAGGLGSTAAKAGVLAVLGATEEGLQEVAEGVATRAGINKAAGTERSLTEGTFGEFVLGAKAGGVTGAGKGLLEGLRGGRDQAPAVDPDPLPGAPPAPNALAPSQEPSAADPVNEPAPEAQPDQAEAGPAVDAAARLAELELLADARELSEAERQEAAGLFQVLQAEEDADNQGPANVQDPTQAPAPDVEPEATGAEGAPALGGGAATAGGVSAETGAGGLEAAGVSPRENVVGQAIQAAQRVLQDGGTEADANRAATDALISGMGQAPDIEIAQDAPAAVQAARAAVESAPILPPLQSGPDVNLQNRDRGRAASVVQMTEIARNPDYMRLGPSRTPDSGAPMVFAVADDTAAIPPENFGRQDVAVMSDGQQVGFRYAVADATKVNPSNFADGRTNEAFSSDLPGTIKALNNGRTAGVRAAHEMGTAGQYVEAMQGDTQMHGISPDVIARTPNPILVRVYADGDNTAGMAAKSQGQGLGMSPSELARQDAPLMDASVLGVYQPGDVTSAANRDFVRAFVGKLQGAGQDVAAMMTGNGELSQDGRKRIQAALMQAAYGDADLVDEMFDSTDTDIKAIGEALKAVAGEWANMRDSARLGAISPDADVTENLLQAIGLIRKARRDRSALTDLVNQPDLLTGRAPGTATVNVLRMFYSGQYFTRAVGRDKLIDNLGAYVRGAMMTSAEPGMFGDDVTPEQLLELFATTTPGEQDAQIEPENSGRAPAGGRTDSGNPAAGQQQERGPVAAPRSPGPDRGGKKEPEQNPDQAKQPDGQGDQGRAEGEGEGARGAVKQAAKKPAKTPEVGPFGPILTQYRGDAQGAIKALTKLQDGEAVGALSHPQVGDIDLVWGKAGTSKSDGLGLAKLVKWHPEVLGDLQGFLNGLRKDDEVSGQNRIRLVGDDGRAVVRLQWDGKAKTWLLTAFESAPRGSTTTDTGAIGVKDDTASLNPERISIVPPDPSAAQSRLTVEQAQQTETALKPRTLLDNGRASDGQPINAGDVFNTSSGRKTTGYPKQAGQRFASQWLINNAILEAEARGDGMNMAAFSGEKPLKDGTLPTASRESLLMYLFGAQPAVVPSILKPLAGRTDTGGNAQDFMRTPGGGLDYGEITPEMGKAMRRQAGKIRLNRGVQNADGTGYGLAHIEANHGDQIRALGFSSIEEFVAHVAGGIQQVWQVPGNSQLLVTAKDGRKDVMFIRLEIAKDGDFYRVNSAFPVRQPDYEARRGMKKIWDGSEPTSAVTGQRPAFATAAIAAPDAGSSQGSPNASGQDLSVPPQDSDSQADSANEQDAAARAKLEQDFRVYPVQILNNLAERGDVGKLYKAAGVKGASAFDGLPMDDKAAAYLKYVAQGGKPVSGLPQDYNAWAQGRERDAEVRRLQSERTVRQANRKPFKTKISAQQFQERFDLTGTHEVVQAPEGFELRQLSPAAQAELKRKADGRESYIEAQEAVAAEMGLGINADGEWDATEAQFDEMERRTQARLRGEPSEMVLSAPTQADIEAQQERAEQAERDRVAADKAAAAREAKERERADVKRLSESAADTFELGGDPMANLTGQKDIFGGDPEPEPDQTETLAFKRWFKDSRVVDADGKPLPMYHGTSASEGGDAFTMFDTFASNYGLMGMGGYFTADPAVASSYTTKGKGTTPTVYQVFLSIQNPLDMDAKADASAWRKQFEGIAEYHDGGTTNESWYRAAEEALVDQRLPKWEGAEIMQDGIRAMGFDGITHIGGGRVKADGVKHRVYIAFDPEQAKSATGNTGAFDPAKADIRFSLTGRSVPLTAGQRVVEATVAQEVEQRIGQFAHQPTVVIRDSAEGVLPGATKADGVAGAVHKGRIFLFLDQLATRADVQETLFHELFHYGVRKIFTRAQFIQEMLTLYERDAWVKERADAWSKTREGRTAAQYGGDKYALARGVDETLARLAEPNAGSYTRTDTFSRASVRITRWLADLAQRLGFTQYAAKLRGIKNEEARDVIQRVFRALQTQSNPEHAGWMDDAEPAFSRSTPPGNSPQPPQGRQAPVSELPAETLPRYFQRRVQDNLNRFTVIKEWLAEQGIKLSETADVYKAEERMHSRYANKAQDFREKRLNPLIQEAQKAGFKLDEVAQFLHAQHAEERNKQVARVNKDRPDGGSGMTTAEANQILAAAPAELKAIADKFRQIAEDTKKTMLKAGIVSQEMVDAWDGAYKHYVPLKGGPDGGASKGTGKGLSVTARQKRALGHDVREEGEWIIENIVSDYERSLMLAEKNRVGLHLMRMAAEAGRDDLITIGKPKRRQVLKNQSAYVVQKNGVRFGVYKTEEAAKLARMLAGVTGVTISKTTEPSVVLMASPQLQDNEVNVFLRGMEIRLQINDELLARAYRNMGDQALGAILDAGRTLNAYFSKIYTGYNPEFIQVNLFRDFAAGLINVTGEEGFGMAIKAARNYPKRFAELFKYARTNNETKWVKMYREDGGNTGAAYLSDMERLGSDIATEYAVYQGVKKNLDDMRAAGTGKEKMKAGWLAARAAGRKVFEKTLVWVERMNQAGENAMRLAAYQAMVESGKTRNEAASLAKNSTVNFNRKGELGKQANALYLFFNAGVQGTAAIAHAHMKGKYKGQARALSASLVALGYAASLLAAGDDDEEKEYEEVNEFERTRNMLIRTEDGFAKIPIPYGYGFFFNAGRVFADAQRTGETGNLPWHLATSLVSEFTPFGNAVAGSEPDAKQAFLYSMPTFAQIIGAPTLNQTGMGGPMMPDSAFDQHQPDRDKMWRQTRGSMADTLAGALEAAGIDVSPETLKHYGRTFTGGAGTFLTSVGDGASLKLSGADLETSEVPFLRKMYMVPDVRGARARYNESKNEVTKYMSDYRRAVKGEKFEFADQLATDNAEMLQAAKMAEAFSRWASSKRDMIDNIRLKGNYSKAEERALVNELEVEEREIYREYLDELKGLKAQRAERVEASR